MNNRVVPAKLANYSKQPIGVSSFKDIQVEQVTLHPHNTSTDQIFRYNTVNKISWRIPSYANSFLDTSRSFFSFNFENTTSNRTAYIGASDTRDDISQQTDMNAQATTDSAIREAMMKSVPGCWIQRLTVKSAQGLILEQIDDFHLLSKLFKLMDVSNSESSPEQGDFSNEGIDRFLDRPVSWSVTGNETNGYAATPQNGENTYVRYDVRKAAQIGRSQHTAQGGQTYTFQLQSGVLSKHLKSYLPIFAMSHSSGFCLDLELTLARPEDVMDRILASHPRLLEFRSMTNDAEVSGGTTAMGLNYRITNPRYHMCLLKVNNDKLMSRFDNISTSSESVIIPFETYHHFENSLTGTNGIYYISESCTDLRKMYNVLALDTDKLSFERLISKYNFKIGNYWLYNEPIEELPVHPFVSQQESAYNDQASISFSHVLNSHYLNSTGKPYCAMLNKSNYAEYILKTNYASNGNFFLASNFTYSDESKGVIQGISTSGLPIQIRLDVHPNATGAVDSNTGGGSNSKCSLHTFTQCGYDLVIKRGELSFVESKPLDDLTY